MTTPAYDVLAIGNAIVDVLVQTQDDVLASHGMVKGTMQLIEEAQAKHLSDSLLSTVLVSGGSAANTVVGVASLGGRSGFIGKVGLDIMGRLFASDLRAAGVDFETDEANIGPATARSFVLVTPDGQRTMSTYLGACRTLHSGDISPSVIEKAQIVYLEGYLWDPPEAKAAFSKAAQLAHTAGGRVAFSLSDPFCVDRYRGEFRELLKTGAIDILFGNEQEIVSLYQTEDVSSALSSLCQEVTRPGFIGVVTRGQQGACAVTRDEEISVPAHPIQRLVDTTGAGDLFASGFLYGLTHKLPLEASLRLGALAAGEVIQSMGARPKRVLKDVAFENGLLAAA